MAAEISLGDQHQDQQVEFELTLLYQSHCTSLKGSVISKTHLVISHGCTR